MNIKIVLQLCTKSPGNKNKLKPNSLDVSGFLRGEEDSSEFLKQKFYVRIQAWLFLDQIVFAAVVCLVI